MAAIYDALSALHGDDKYADLTVTCGDHTFKLHRAVVCPQSPFFENACSGGFMEAFTGHVDLGEENPEIVAKFLQFMYTGNYSDEDHLDPEGCDEAVLQPVEDLLFSLRHRTDLPGSDLYDMSLWSKPKEYYKDFGNIICEKEYHSNFDGRICKCGTCLCDDPEDTGLCKYDWRQEKYRCADQNYSSDGEDDSEDEELDGDFCLDDDGYVTELPHAMFTSVRVYAMADMFC
ncbi:hypothetical protein C8A01DRAFT_41456 [Parachaetomium inaequale]|uniref:BTB domain-containing protein n=1 Tax=Parachaetomium inaequale TaxID=2588326 RepID=A0AAN6SLJ4_9PEZI|nr:hypothetical protein C8A01DRAFT_41456 [Parachaetomium inaequale]